MILPLYQGLATIGWPFVECLLARRAKRGKEDSARLNERRGLSGIARPAGRLVWLHAASVGESIAALALIDRLMRAEPKTHVLMTTGTTSSARLMATRLPQCALHQFIPVDRPAWMRRFLDHWHPDLALIMESDFWPTQLVETRRRGIPIILVNARMSPRSFARWRLVGRFGRALFSSIDLALATNPAQAEHFTALGVPRVQAVGNLKRAAIPIEPENDDSFAADALAGRPVWLAASTHPGEDEPVIEAQRALLDTYPGLLCLIAPRHPDRGPGIADLARARGLRVARRGAAEPLTPDTQVYVADTLGEMEMLFKAARIVFVAGSLVPVGGHNPIEPAHYDCAILFGPLMAKNAEIASEMKASGSALEVADGPALRAAIDMLVRDEEQRRQLAANARNYVAGGSVLLDEVYAEIMPFLSSSSSATTSTAATARDSLLRRLFFFLRWRCLGKVMKAPDFWKRDGILPHLLTLFGAGYEWGVRRRRARAHPGAVPVPVICVGNLVVGGSGKTPVALSLCRLLREMGENPATLSRGYGGRLAGPVRVDPAYHDAGAVGDEALLAAEQGPAWIACNRLAGARAAVAAKDEATSCGIIVMDDGFQNPHLKKDFSLLVVDGVQGFGNGRVMPAGPLRESCGAGFARADALVLIGEDRAGVLDRLPENLTVLRADVKQSPLPPDLQAGARVFGFAGIARPERFRDILPDLGLERVGFKAFADHHPFRVQEIAGILEMAARLDARPVTTAKDHVRLPAAQRARVARLDITLIWRDEAAVKALLARIIEAGEGGGGS